MRSSIVAFAPRVVAAHSSRPLSTSPWASTWMAPPDPILGLTEAFNKDTDPRKINLGVGAYRDDNGKPYVLSCVKKAEKRIVEAGMDKEYAGITGVKKFVDSAVSFALGADHPVIKEGRFAATQTISGTGACSLAGMFFALIYGVQSKTVFLPNPTWANHIPIFRRAGFNVQHYAYFNPSNCSLNLQGMLEDISKAQEGSIFLLHACAHNPTGVDPTSEQWKAISKALKERNHVVFVDMAYQGFASGDAEKDATGLRTLIADGHNLCFAQSFAKNFGLYGERVGALTFVGADAAEAKKIESLLKITIRPVYSNPPIHGARIVSEILNDKELTAEWRKECKGMADRIISMRTLLKNGIIARGSKQNWDHITNQIGMFAFTGLKEQQVAKMIGEHHIYLTKDGRVSMAGVTSKNVDHLANAIAEVSK